MTTAENNVMSGGRQRGHGRNHAPVSVCVVDACGVSAEWIEATVATSGQATFVQLVRAASNADEGRAAAQVARYLAVHTGGRVFNVSCRPGTEAAVEDAVTAYCWLLHEGLEASTTAIITPHQDRRFEHAVREALTIRGLPGPGASHLGPLPMPG